jgi:hypothetical protein
MKTSNKNYDVARALSAALEPLIDVCLQIGLTSPELESLVQIAFVQRAFVRLPRHSRTGRGASAVRVSLASGVHRAKVRKIHSSGAGGSADETMGAQKWMHSKSGRVLRGWMTDVRFTTSGGHPLDLPLERNKQRRSFEDLVAKFAPSTHAGTVLKELRRRGNVQLLEHDIVRFVSETAHASVMNEASVARAAKRIKRLGDTLLQNIADSRQRRLYEETEPVSLNARQLALVRPILERRTKTFLAALESELRGRGDLGLEDNSKRVGISVFAWEDE